MTNLISTHREAQGIRLPARRTADLAKPIAQAVERAEGEAIVNSARVHGAGYVTHLALGQLHILSREEHAITNDFPPDDLNGRLQAEARARTLVDTFVGVAAVIIGSMA